MKTAARLSAYGAAVVLFGAGAFATGATIDAPTAHLRPTAQTADHGADPAAGHGAPTASRSTGPAGLASTEGGLTLTPASNTLPARQASELAFRITGPDGAAITGFDIEHEKRMHLIVVRSDTAYFQHLHPTMDPDGTWRAPITLPGGGTYRTFADFAPTGGEATTLGVDLFAPGSFAPVAPQANRTATAPGGYEVTLDGVLEPGRSSPVTLTVTRHGQPVRDLQPYLGAYGHLVALRSGDLGYLHVHPDGAPGDGTTESGPGITFHTEVPSTGTYRLFLDFQHDGQVRTAQFTVPTTGSAPAAPGSVETGHPHTDGGH
ncbi:hypothetical protein [Pseudonocardia alni]|jgi:hypothetical protein|uniref:Secreted protein n=2 Tax=Pseudonocardia alni TaxID=33907 RepID=A0AA44UUZ8_PSEA5|nr:hypothetical protein [Pseudonocardia alni]NWJ74997.1 hypothetical protein [Pseudonocardia pini]NWJ75135.1 hypothetical protein [Pseudonocardia pini]PKB41318.1 hypothetical protein ATL51_0280 [Pseudonocardia alni]